MVIGNGFFSENREAALAEMTERSGCEVKHLPYPTVGSSVTRSMQFYQRYFKHEIEVWNRIK